MNDAILEKLEARRAAELANASFFSKRGMTESAAVCRGTAAGLKAAIDLVRAESGMEIETQEVARV